MSTEDDVFQDNSPTIVDCDVLEAAKENIQPLASGRRVTVLSALLTTPHAQRDAKLSATRNRLRINVELALDDEDDDPLEAYCRLVYWTLENYPQGHSAESGLLELLEEATRVLKDDRDGVWRGELKYLKLWLLYASFVEKPAIIYKFLIANEIGTSFALLYEEYAAVLERDGRRKDADDAYTLGIARRASPVEHLQARHQEFQKRMMSATSLPSPPPTTSAPSRPKRLALATSSVDATASTSRIPSTPTVVASGSNAPMQVFVDPTGSASQSAEPPMNAWPDLGTRKTRIKENVPEVKKLAGSTLKQAGRYKRVISGSGPGTSSATAPDSRIVPFRDPGPADMPPPPVPASKKAAPKTLAKSSITPFLDSEASSIAVDVPAAPRFTPFRDEDVAVASPTTAAGAIPESVMKVKKAGVKAPAPAPEAEALRKDPLRNYGLAADIEAANG